MAAILALLGISGLGGLVNFPLDQPLAVAPQLLRVDSKEASQYIFALACIYCGTTFIAAFALWRLRPWARVAYLGFIAGISIYILGFSYLIRIPTPLFLFTIFYGLLCAGLYWGWIVVSRAFPKTRIAS